MVVRALQIPPMGYLPIDGAMLTEEHPPGVGNIGIHFISLVPGITCTQIISQYLCHFYHPQQQHLPDIFLHYYFYFPLFK